MKKILEKVVRSLIRKMVTVIQSTTMPNVIGTEVIVVVPLDITVSDCLKKHIYLVSLKICTLLNGPN